MTRKLRKKLTVKRINWGIASRVNNVIYMNKRLLRYPKLKKALLSHEMAHTEGFRLGDVLLDVGMDDLKGLRDEYYSFILNNPTSWVEYLPIKKYGGNILFNPALLMMWLFAGGFILYIIINIL